MFFVSIQNWAGCCEDKIEKRFASSVKLFSSARRLEWRKIGCGTLTQMGREVFISLKPGCKHALKEKGVSGRDVNRRCQGDLFLQSVGVHKLVRPLRHWLK